AYSQRDEEVAIYCPKAFAGSRPLPSSLADRSIPIVLARVSERSGHEPFRRSTADLEAAPLRDMLEQWAAAHREAAQAVARVAERTAGGFRESLPYLSSHQWDGLEPLLLLADLLGGDCPARARLALIEVFRQSLSPE